MSEPGSEVLPPRDAGPVRESERLAALDVLRGFALLGVCVVNMQFFAMPFIDAIEDPSLAQASTASQLIWALIRIVFEWKSISLFSLLFGMGLVLQMNRAEGAGNDFRMIYLRRLGVLFAIGAVHVLFFWYGDILLLYAALGLGLLLCRNLRPRTLLVAAAACIAVGAILMTLTVAGGIFAEQFFEDEEIADNAADPAAGETEEPAEADPPPKGVAAIVAASGDPYDPRWKAGEIAAYRHGPFLDALAFRVLTYVYGVIAAVIGYGWRVFGLFLAGAALLKLGFFSAEKRHWQRALAVTGFAVGLPMEVASAGITHALDYEASWGSLGAHVLHETGSLLLCLGYAGSIALLTQSRSLAWLWHALACVGRLALSNYLLQTLIATFVMYWWGLGLFGQVSRSRQLLLAAGVYATLSLASVLWLRGFRIGPAEWLWRSLTYGERQPFRRAPRNP